METGDGVLTWRVLRQVGIYVDTWRMHGAIGPAHALEPGPFQIRFQDRADLEAGWFELLAWEDPFDADGPASPFWHQDGMLEAVVDSGAEPLAAVVGDDGVVEGLRLLGGDLVLKTESGGVAVQGRIRDAPRIPDGVGVTVRHDFGLRMPHSMRTMTDFWNTAGRTGPGKGRARRAGRPGRIG